MDRESSAPCTFGGREAPKRNFMKTHSHFFTDLAAGLLLFGGTLILAQTTTTAKKAPATTTTSASKQAVTTAPATSSDAESVEAKSLDSAHATESTQRKHIAGVKYEDRAVGTTSTTSGGESSSGVASNPVQPNAMAIKENGISNSKPVAKPHQ
jgi:hypothetical protein